jgi:murein DD-endopeptidase MepM/ murein hydrolase activator NlpD
VKRPARVLTAGPVGLGLALMAAASVPTDELASAAQPAIPASEEEQVAPASGFELAGELTQGGWIRGTMPKGAVSVTLDGVAVGFAGDGKFFAAFDRDAGAGAKLVAKMANGTTLERDLTISRRAWDIEKVDIARTVSVQTDEFLKRRAPELEQINAARAFRSDSDGWKQAFIWPVKGRISGKFGSQRIYKGGEAGSYHSGIDIATGESGTPFVAPADGVVILVAQQPFTLEGNLLMIDHGMGLNSAFLHCSEVEVKLGDHVKQGQFIGRIGMTGRATGPHLHWSLRWHDARLDPLLFTGPMG